MSTVPGNKLQQRLGDYRRESLAPSPGERYIALGVIMKVYEPEDIQNMAKSPEQARANAGLIRKYLKAPGLVYADVLMLNGREQHIFAFKGDYQTYIENYKARIDDEGADVQSGNNPISSHRLVRIEFQNNNYTSGRCVPAHASDRVGLGFEKMVEVFDIGGLFGG